jgi:cephalosporin hydroxylase
MKFKEPTFYNQILKYVKRKKSKNAKTLSEAAKKWLRISYENKIYYEWSWLGIPIIQTPSDMMMMQEILFQIRPRIFVETGVAHGGSLIFYSSILRLIYGDDYLVIGIERDFRPHNRKILEQHPLYRNIKIIEGDSVVPTTIVKIKQLMANKSGTVMVALDSYHGKNHVLKELELYADFVSLSSYLIVFDTIIDILDDNKLTDRSVSKLNSPKYAIEEFLQKDKRFIIDKNCNKLFISHAYNGFLKKVKK